MAISGLKDVSHSKNEDCRIDHIHLIKNRKGGTMTKSRHLMVMVSLLLATMFIVSFATTQIYAAEYKLRIACSHKPDSPWVQAAQYFAKELEALSGGRIEVSVHHSATLGNTREVCEMVRNNTLEAAIPGAAQLSTYTPEIGVTVLAYIFKSNESMFSVLDGPIGGYIDSKLAEANFHNLGWYKNGFRSVTNNKRPIEKLEDFNGLKLRVLPSPSVMAFFKEVGVNPIHIDWAELFEAMKKGVVDGQENPPFFVWSGKVYEINKYYSFTKHMNEPGILVLSKKYYDNLPEDLRLMVDVAAKKAEMWERAKMTEANDECLTKLKEAGMQINEIPESELERFRKVTYEKVYPAIVKNKDLGPYTKELIDMVLWAQE
jgi:tripartite ATP-independent transporter DctP family solute receptor